MNEDEQLGYQVLLRIAKALEGINTELMRMNDVGLVIINDVGANEN